MRLLDDEALAEIGRAPVERVRDALARGEEGRAAEVAAGAIRAWERGIEGFRVWIVHTIASVAEHHGAAAAGAALAVLTEAMATRTPWPDEVPEGTPRGADGAGPRLAASPAAGEPGILAELLAAERALRTEHDAWLDAVCVILSHVYRTLGIDALHAAMEDAGDRTLLAWMPRDLTRAPQERVRTWATMLQGNFASITVEEDDEKFAITQDPCGSCGRQLAAGRHPGPLDLATVEEVHPITFERGHVPVYRTHVAVMHFLAPEARIGVPWPVVACPAGLAPGPCRVLLYKDPLDPAAQVEAARLRGGDNA